MLVRRCLGILITAGLLVPQVAGAATITTNTTSDQFGEFTAPPQCALREAVQAANTNALFGGCEAGSASGTDEIVQGRREAESQFIVHLHPHRRLGSVREQEAQAEGEVAPVGGERYPVSET